MVARSDTAGLRQYQQNSSDSPNDITFYPRYVLSPVRKTDKAGVTHTLVPGRTHEKQIIAPSSDSLACACSIAYFASLQLGNPGLLDFYLPFLSAIHHSVNSDPSPRTSSSSSSSSSPSSTPTPVTIFAHSHLGLSSYIRPISNANPDKNRCLPFSWPEKSSVALRAQIQAHLEFLDELLLAYCDDDPATRVLLVGHSIGCWLVQEMLKARAAGALRPRVGAYMLFPTISDIARSPNGRKLSVRTPYPAT